MSIFCWPHDSMGDQTSTLDLLLVAFVQGEASRQTRDRKGAVEVENSLHSRHSGSTVSDSLSVVEFACRAHRRLRVGWPCGCGLQPRAHPPPTHTPGAGPPSFPCSPAPAVRRPGPRCVGFAPVTLCSRLFPLASRQPHANYQLSASSWNRHNLEAIRGLSQRPRASRTPGSPADGGKRRACVVRRAVGADSREPEPGQPLLGGRREGRVRAGAPRAQEWKTGRPGPLVSGSPRGALPVHDIGELEKERDGPPAVPLLPTV